MLPTRHAAQPGLALGWKLARKSKSSWCPLFCLVGLKVEVEAGSVLIGQPTRHAVVLAADEEAGRLDAEQDEVPCQLSRVPHLAVAGFQFVPLVGDGFGLDWLAAVG